MTDRLRQEQWFMRETNKLAISVKEAALALGVSRAWLYAQWRKNCGPERIKVSGRTLICTEALERWLRESTLR